MGSRHRYISPAGSNLAPMSTDQKQLQIQHQQKQREGLHATISVYGTLECFRDHKEKTSQHPLRQEVIPGADNDKREKIRQKNEKKHQRQKEKRARIARSGVVAFSCQENLESLANNFVSMGFSSERATLALILNEGKIEESVAWLFEGGEEADDHNEHKLDGGDLDRTAETLRAQKQDPPPSAPPKLEETGDPPIISNGKLSVSCSQNSFHRF
ncbi:hypothetical protein LOK49_Contig77G00010 [Camellia lanceoleosa]|nr:hypothetical protein LOK49_Contig77G00010 [Camellia lanceoleosa]